MSARTILIVDDEADIREIAQFSMELGGAWRALTAGSGRQAVDLATATRPDAILLDVMMPGLDGPKTLELLRMDPRTRTVPVVFLTAKAQLSERRQLRNLDVSGVIAKPFDPMTLAQRVAEIVESQALGSPARGPQALGLGHD